MVEIEPFKFQQCTAFKERYQLGNKLNEVIDYLNNGGGGGSSGVNFEEVDFATLQEHFNNHQFDKMVIMRLKNTMYGQFIDYVFYPNMVYNNDISPPVTFINQSSLSLQNVDIKSIIFTMTKYNDNLVFKEANINFRNGEITVTPYSNSYIPLSYFKFYMAV